MKKKILIINVNWIGDVLFSTPFIKALRDAYPDSYIASLLHPRCSQMLEANPRLNEIITYDEEGAHKSLFGKAKLIAELRKKKFDTAYILHRSFTKALIVKLAGIRESIGYPDKNRASLLTKVVEIPDEETHKVEYFLNILRASGIKTGDVSYEFFVRDEDRAFAKGIFAANGISEKDLVVAICPGGNWDPKRWPKENFASLSDLLAEKFGAKVIITGAKKDENLGREIEGLMKSPAINISGKTDLKELSAILERANLVIANDTGSMHLAVAVKTKVIALFGPTSPVLTGPYGIGTYRVLMNNQKCEVPCYDVTCKDNICMKAISVGDVLKTAGEMLGKL